MEFSFSFPPFFRVLATFTSYLRLPENSLCQPKLSGRNFQVSWSKCRQWGLVDCALGGQLCPEESRERSEVSVDGACLILQSQSWASFYLPFLLTAFITVLLFTFSNDRATKIS